MVHEREENEIAIVEYGREEAPGLILSQVARGLLAGVREDGQRGQERRLRSPTARTSRKAQSGTRIAGRPLNPGPEGVPRGGVPSPSAGLGTGSDAANLGD